MCHVLWTEAYLRRRGDEEQAEVSDWLPSRALMMSGPGLLLGPRSGFLVLMQMQSLLMSGF